MWRLLFIFILIHATTASAFELVVSNNMRGVWFSDSFSQDSSAVDPSDNQQYDTGFQAEAYIHGGWALMNPATNIYFLNASRSGETPQGILTNHIQQQGLPFWAADSNPHQNISVFHMGSNGGMNSNSAASIINQVAQAPTNMSDGAAGLVLVSQSGWAATNSVQSIILSDVPREATTEDSNWKARRDAVTNAVALGATAPADAYTLMLQPVTNDYANYGGTNVQWHSGGKGGHPGKGGQLGWAISFFRQTTTQTNVSNCEVDWNASVVSTNNCVVSSISRTGNTLTFTRRDFKLPMPFDKEGSVWFQLVPADADFFRFTLQVDNLPPGTYSVSIGGTNVATLSHTQLGAGWNMFTNTVGPVWDKRMNTLNLIRDLEYADRTTLVQGSSGQGIGTPGYFGQAFVHWQAGHRGDTLIADMASQNTYLNTNFFAPIHTSVQPADFVYTVALITPRFAPAHR